MTTPAIPSQRRAIVCKRHGRLRRSNANNDEKVDRNEGHATAGSKAAVQ
ncbi:MAG: hypothetical protein O3A33_11420 [Chloroflexi bacterium]|nr:hypothetical protein [Chloroflexota bacterium]